MSSPDPGYDDPQPPSRVSGWDGPATTTYRFQRALGMRVVGPVLIAAGVAWLVGGLLGFGTVVLVVLGLLSLVALALVLRLVAVPPRVLVLTTDGYRVFHLRGAGVTRAAWAQVSSVTARRSTAGPVVSLELDDGRTTTVPFAVLGNRSGQVQTEINARLNSAFGYRSLPDQEGTG